MKNAAGPAGNAAAEETGLWFESALLPSGWARKVRIAVRGGLIGRIDTDTGPLAGDERHSVALPGLSNLHSHAFQRAMAGLTEQRGPAATGDSFWTWRELMYRFVERLEPHDIHTITAQAYVEMLEAGFTRVGEFHYLHHAPDGVRYADIGELLNQVTAAAGDTGIGLTLLPVFYAHSNFGGQQPSPGQRRFINTLDGFSQLMSAARAAVKRLDGGVAGVAPHSLRAVTPAELEIVVPMAGGGPVHIHAAEQVQEVDACLAWSGKRPVQWLLDHASIDQTWCLIHATHLDEREIQGLARSGAVAGLCPLTEANLGDGFFPAPEYLAAGGAFGIGTDSNIRIDAAEELRFLESAQRLVHRSRNVLAGESGQSTGRRLFEAALAGGARALGAPTQGLEAGAPADIVTLNTDHPALVERAGDSLLDSWIFAAGREAIDCVWRQGRKRVKNGRHAGRALIATRYGRTLRKLLG